MRKPVGVVAPDDPVGEPEGVGHGPVGQERDEGPLQHLRIARVGLEGLAIVARRGGGVARARRRYRPQDSCPRGCPPARSPTPPAPAAPGCARRRPARPRRRPRRRAESGRIGRKGACSAAARGSAPGWSRRRSLSSLIGKSARTMDSVEASAARRNDGAVHRCLPGLSQTSAEMHLVRHGRAEPGHDAEGGCRAASRRVLALGPGSPSTPLRCVAGVRESAVGRASPDSIRCFPERMQRAEGDPGASARLRRERCQRFPEASERASAVTSRRSSAPLPPPG